MCSGRSLNDGDATKEDRSPLTPFSTGAVLAYSVMYHSTVSNIWKYSTQKPEYMTRSDMNFRSPRTFTASPNTCTIVFVLSGFGGSLYTNMLGMIMSSTAIPEATKT